MAVKNKPRRGRGSADLRIPVLQSVLCPALLDAAEAESLFGERRHPRLRLL